MGKASLTRCVEKPRRLGRGYKALGASAPRRTMPGVWHSRIVESVHDPAPGIPLSTQTNVNRRCRASQVFGLLAFRLERSSGDERVAPRARRKTDGLQRHVRVSRLSQKRVSVLARGPFAAVATDA